MTFLALNMLIAICWAALWNSFSAASLLAGFGLGYLALWFARGIGGDGAGAHYFRMVPQSVCLTIYFCKEFILSCLYVARDALAREPALHPAIVEMPLDAKTDLEIFLVANLISLTPGTLTLDVAPDRSFLVIHSIYAKDPDKLVADLKSGMEAQVLKVFR